MNHTSSRAVFDITRRSFFATTVGALVASVLPVKAAAKVDEHEACLNKIWPRRQCPKCDHAPVLREERPSNHGTDLKGGDLPYHVYVCVSCETRFWHDWFWNEFLVIPHPPCQINRPFHRKSRRHWHPPGKPYMTCWLPDPRYPS